jgi:hypothetical protein
MPLTVQGRQLLVGSGDVTLCAQHQPGPAADVRLGCDLGLFSERDTGCAIEDEAVLQALNAAAAGAGQPGWNVVQHTPTGTPITVRVATEPSRADAAARSRRC